MQTRRFFTVLLALGAIIMIVPMWVSYHMIGHSIVTGYENELSSYATEFVREGIVGFALEFFSHPADLWIAYTDPYVGPIVWTQLLLVLMAASLIWRRRTNSA